VNAAKALEADFVKIILGVLVVIAIVKVAQNAGGVGEIIRSLFGGAGDVLRIAAQA